MIKFLVSFNSLFILVFLVALTGSLAIDPIFAALGASEAQTDLIHTYMSVWFVGVGLVVIPMVGNSAIRATGDTKTPSRIMLLAAAVNIILDPLLIFGIGPFPRLELTGAALATLISYSLTFLFSIWVLGVREKMLTFTLPSPSELWQSWQALFKLAIPAAATNMMVPVTIGILTHLAASFGDAAVAALGVGTRVESLAMIGVMAISRISRQDGVHLDLHDFLFGNVLGVSNEDLYLTGFVMIYVIASVIVFYRYLFATTFQSVIAETMGISVQTVHYYLMLLLSFAVVAALKTVGVILVVAMLITPASTALSTAWSLIRLQTHIIMSLISIICE